MKSRSARHHQKFFRKLLTKKPYENKHTLGAESKASKSASSSYLHINETGIATEMIIKLYVGLFISLIAGISLMRLLPYHFAQSIKLKELKSQVKETEYRVKSKKMQLIQNFDPQQAENLREKYSSRIDKGRVRLFLRNKRSSPENKPKN